MRKQVKRYFPIIHNNLLPLVICFIFSIAYTTLSVVRHLHFGSYGFDLGISDQVVWKYSHFISPVTTIQSYAFTSILTDHVEFIYFLLSPFYWIYSSPITLLILQAFLISFSGLPIYLLAKKNELHKWLQVVLLISYLLFFGIQNAIWFDVHSLVFGAAFLTWYLYFLDTKNIRFTMLFFLLSILCKEDMALFTGAISFMYLIKRRDTLSIYVTAGSVLYLFMLFFIYFPHFTTDGYRYGNPKGLMSDIHISYLLDTNEKRNTLLYSLAWFGFIPLLSPLFLFPALADLSHYFVLDHLRISLQGIFMHYRVTLAPLLVLPTILAVSRFAFLNNKYIAIYLLIVALFFQYYLHLPLSYLTKSWFWREPVSVKSITTIIQSIPSTASIVSQNNITPHVSQRNLIFTLYPTVKKFSQNSPCGSAVCSWFRWSGDPSYLLVNTSSDWDARGFLVDREAFIDGLKNMEKSGVIKKYKQNNETILYHVVKRP